MSAFLGLVHFHPGSVSLYSSCIPDQALLSPVRTWTSPGAILLHRQRVVTPEDSFERQPTSAWSGSGAVLFDGRIDDRADLAAKLGLPLRDDVSDSFLVARAFEKWAEEAPAHFSGDFAAAAWLATDRHLILCTDRAGLRPLYYHRTGDVATFGTVLPALFAAGVPFDVEPRTVANLLEGDLTDSTRTFYRGVKRLLKGTSVTLRAAGERAHTYWAPGRASSPIRGSRGARRADGSDCAAAAAEVLSQAIASKRRAIHSVAMTGSGGLDSACIIGLATRSSEITAFVSVPDPSLPVIERPRTYTHEQPLVEALCAAFPGARAIFVEPDREPEAEYAPEKLFEIAAVPLGGVVPYGWIERTLRAISESGAQAILGGHYGNLTISWDGVPGLSELFTHGRWIRLLREASVLAEGDTVGTARLFWHAAIPRLKALRRRKATVARGFLNPRAKAELEPDETQGYMSYFGPNHRLRLWNTTTAFAADSMAYTRARYGIETRDPTADHRVVDFCFSIPLENYLHNGEKRLLARRMLRALGAPAAVSENPKRGEWCPEWFAHLTKRLPSFGAEVEAIRRSPLASSLIDVVRLDAAVRAWPRGTSGIENRRSELEHSLVRALHVGAFLRWTEEKKSWKPRDSTELIVA